MDLKDIKITKLENTFTDQYNLPDPVCINKFAWSTIHFSISQSMSCHRVNGEEITPETYDNFHNTPSKIRDRELMLQGKWPVTNGPDKLQAHHGCEVCREIEAAGGISERKQMNSNVYIHDLVPKEIKQNSNSTSTTPTILEAFFGNLCNLACIYCTPKCSSTIAAEHYRHKEINSLAEIGDVSVKRKTYSKLLDAHWKWMSKNASSLNRYHILGGEPFLQEELDQNIDFFMNNKCPNLTISLFSNLSVDKNKFRDKLEKIRYLIVNNHIKNLNMFCSFDCWGPQIEYIRYGVNLNQWEENFLILLNEFPEINIHIHSTITSLTFDTFPDLCQRIKYWTLIRPVKHTITTVDSRPFLHPGIFPEKFFELKIKESIKQYQDIINLLQKVEYRLEADQKERIPLIRYYHEVIAQLKGFEKTFDAHKFDVDLLNKLKVYLNTNDYRRKTNWKQLWPWLHELVEQHVPLEPKQNITL